LPDRSRMIERRLATLRRCPVPGVIRGAGYRVVGSRGRASLPIPVTRYPGGRGFERDLHQRFAAYMVQKRPQQRQSRDRLPHISCMSLARPHRPTTDRADHRRGHIDRQRAMLPVAAPTGPPAPSAAPQRSQRLHDILRASSLADARTSVQRETCDQHAPQRPRDPPAPGAPTRTGTAARREAAPLRWRPHRARSGGGSHCAHAQPQRAWRARYAPCGKDVGMQY
jgi:hypothetical protein